MTLIPQRHFPKSGFKLAKMLHYHNLIHLWRELNTSRKDYTFYSHVHNTYSRIDHFFMVPSAVSLFRLSKIVDVKWSDHSAVWTACDFLQCFSGPAPWRLNDSLLSNPSICFDIKQNLKEYFAQNDPLDTSVVNTWAAHKATIRGHFIQIASRLKKTSDSLISQKDCELSNLLTQHKDNPDLDLRAQIDLVRLELNLCLTTRAEK